MMKKIFGSRGGFFIGTLAAILLFPAILMLNLPEGFGLGFRYQFLPIFVSSLAVFYFSRNASGRLPEVLILGFSLSVFSVVLSGFLRGGVSELNNIGGLLPFGDANQYFQSAVQLIHGERFGSTNGRPLFPGYLATILALASGNLRVSLGVTVFASAVACFFAVREVRRSHGWLPGMLVFVLLFQFYRRFAGETLTENLGFPMGAIGFAMIWNSVREKRLAVFLSGLFCLTLALNARAGAFFVLPALVMWGMYRFGQRALPAGTAVVALAFACNFLLAKTLLPKQEPMFSNYSVTLYGVLNDGDWTKVYKDHPEIHKLNTVDRNWEVYRLAMESIMSDPSKLVKGSVRAWVRSRFFSYVIPLYPEQTRIRNEFEKVGYSGVWKIFSRWPYGVVNLAFQKIYYLLVNILFVLGALWCIFRRKDPYCSMIIWAGLGIIVSVPFIPPWDADDMRIYAATIPLLAAVPAVVLGGGVNHEKTQSHLPVGNDALLQWFGWGFAVFCVVGPLLTKNIFTYEHPAGKTSCPEGTSPYFVNAFPGSYVFLSKEEGQAAGSAGVNVSVDDFKKRLSIFRMIYQTEASALESLGGGKIIAIGGKMAKDSGSYLVFEPEEFEKIRGFSLACAARVGSKSRFTELKSVHIPK
ncbi:MAG: hypothetical protein QF701_16715 [Nitrospinota bacterium]|nr:hypothetical protein [Nitrospinota bacterium]MDP7169369.1 hypothetical protein [Nitrospinota bacterium]